MTTDSRFNPCPFCGNADIRSDKHPDYRSPTGRWFSMCCYTCGARVENCASIEPMIEKWNRRATAAALDSRDALLADAAKALEPFAGRLGEAWRNCLVIEMLKYKDRDIPAATRLIERSFAFANSTLAKLKAANKTNS